MVGQGGITGELDLKDLNSAFHYLETNEGAQVSFEGKILNSALALML